MMTDIRIRPAMPEDVERIAELERRTFPFPWSAESIRHDIEGNPLATVVVGEDCGIFAGYADVWRIAGEAQLNNIAVLPEHQGKHVGLRIMEHLLFELKAQGDKCMMLEVREGNHRAICLYEKLGFFETGRRTNYYLDNGETAILMQKDL